LIDTGNPDQTASDFANAVNQIRQASISCSVKIPAAGSGPGFDKQSVAVHFKGKNGTTSLAYDKACTGAGWHYDNVDNPSEIVLCESSCNAVRADADAKLEVEFACEPIFLL
jgi:hypothetical protein